MTPLVSHAILRTQSDARLVALARGGNEGAFEAIVDRYTRALHRHCRRVLPETRCDDAVQQTFVNAWAALDRGDEVRDLKPWLYRIAQNVVLNTVARSGYDYDELHDSLRSVPSSADDAERRDVIRSTLAGVAALPERQRAALLAVAGGQPHGEVASQLGMTDGALRQMLHRARTTLRAAATAITPMPLVSWAAGAHSMTAERVAEVAGSVGGAGLAGAAMKTGAVAVTAVTLAGGAVGGVHVLRHDPTPSRPAATTTTREAAAPPVAPTGAPVLAAARTPTAATPGAQRRGRSGSTPAARRRAARHGDGSHGHTGDDARRGSSGSSGHEAEDEHTTSHEGEGSSGSGRRPQRETEHHESSSSGETGGSSGSEDDAHTSSSGSGGSASGESGSRETSTVETVTVESPSGESTTTESDSGDPGSDTGDPGSDGGDAVEQPSTR